MSKAERRLRRRAARRAAKPAPTPRPSRTYSPRDVELFIGDVWLGQEATDVLKHYARNLGQRTEEAINTSRVKGVPLRPEQLQALHDWLQKAETEGPPPKILKDAMLITLDEVDKPTTREGRLALGVRYHEHVMRQLQMQSDTLDALERRRERNARRTPEERAQHEANVAHLETLLRRSKKTGMLERIHDDFFSTEKPTTEPIE